MESEPLAAKTENQPDQGFEPEPNTRRLLDRGSQDRSRPVATIRLERLNVAYRRIADVADSDRGRHKWEGKRPLAALASVLAILVVVGRSDRTRGIPNHVENRLYFVLNDAIKRIDDKLGNYHRIAVELGSGRPPLRCDVPPLDADHCEHNGDGW